MCVVGKSTGFSLGNEGFGCTCSMTEREEGEGGRERERERERERSAREYEIIHEVCGRILKFHFFFVGG